MIRYYRIENGGISRVQTREEAEIIRMVDPADA
jgi:hypothetical protein